MANNNSERAIEISKRIKKSMEDKHMSATELANATGIGKSDISNYLNAKYIPKQDRITKMAYALDVDTKWLSALDLCIPYKSEEPIDDPLTDEITRRSRPLSTQAKLALLTILRQFSDDEDNQ